jgi:hypothetical protein
MFLGRRTEPELMDALIGGCSKGAPAAFWILRAEPGIAKSWQTGVEHLLCQVQSLSPAVLTRSPTIGTYLPAQCSRGR